MRMIIIRVPVGGGSPAVPALQWDVAAALLSGDWIGDGAISRAPRVSDRHCGAGSLDLEASEDADSATTALDVSAPGAAGAAPLEEILVVGRKPNDALKERSQYLDEARDKDLLPKLGATTYTIDQAALDTLPQGKNTPLDKVLLQAPGVSYDSAISNPDFHVRNKYANVHTESTAYSCPMESRRWGRCCRPISSPA